ncbi:MAG: medium chain dehydrogenase/reductase family protein [Sandaracinaceae bacterium]
MTAVLATPKTSRRPTPARPNTKVRFLHYGGPECLAIVEEPPPVPGRGEVRVRVEASSVQFTDTLIRRGLYPMLKDRPPLTPGYDLVGVVDEVGTEVTRWRVGDRVADLMIVGGNARYAVRPADGLVRVPARVDAAEATTLVLSWLTAYQCLHRAAEAQPGERLLVIGGNGAVGRALVDLGVAAGLEVYATAAARHHGALAGRGATPLPRDDWHREVATVGGVDIVVDGVAAGGFGPSYRSLRRGGRLIAIGASGPAAGGSLLRTMLPFVGAYLRRLLPDGRTPRVYSITDERAAHPAWFAEDLSALLVMLEEGRIKPDVAERLRFEDVPDAHARLEAGGLSGKLVLTPRSGR